MLDALLNLYVPSDTRQGHAEYGATCGPCSFAALARKEVREVRHLFPSFPEKTFTNLPMMTRALRQAGYEWTRTDKWPENGMALICGQERYYSRHWVAVSGVFVYEVSLEMWLPKALWERDFLPEMAFHAGTRPDEWRLEAGLEVRKHLTEMLL